MWITSLFLLFEFCSLEVCVHILHDVEPVCQSVRHSHDLILSTKIETSVKCLLYCLHCISQKWTKCKMAKDGFQLTRQNSNVFYHCFMSTK